MILSIEELRALAKRRIPRAIFDYADGGSYQESTLRANAADLDAMSFPSARHGGCVGHQPRDHARGKRGRDAAGHRTHGSLRSLPCRRRDSRRTRGCGVRHSVLPQHDVDLLDRGCGCGDGQAVLVSAISDARSRIQSSADRARDRRPLFGARAHAGSADPGRAAARRSQWPVDPAAAHAAKCVGHRDQACLGFEGDVRQAAQFRQSGRTHRRCRRRSHARAVDALRSSTPPRTGATWNGFGAAGPAD